MDSSIAAVMPTSPTSGTLRIVLGASPSIAATMCFDTAFFDPRTRISPRSGPEGSTCHVSVTQITVRATSRAESELSAFPRAGGHAEDHVCLQGRDLLRAQFTKHALAHLLALAGGEGIYGGPVTRPEHDVPESVWAVEVMLARGCERGRVGDPGPRVQVLEGLRGGDLVPRIEGLEQRRLDRPDGIPENSVGRLE